MMKKIIDILNHLGFPINVSTNPIVSFLGWILVCIIFALLCIVNILIFVGVIYLLEDKIEQIIAAAANAAAATPTKLNESYDELTKLDISDYFIYLYYKYSEFLDSLNPDKIVCLFNIIINGLILSSFISVLSIMLSENIINQIAFLEKYPRILKLLKLRNVINKKVSKFYLLMHFILIISGILGNIYMFFI